VKVEQIFCDVCGKENARTSWFYVDRRMDGAGSMDDHHDPIDLCGGCAWTAYKLAEKSLCFDQTRAIAKELQSRGSRRRKAQEPKQSDERSHCLGPLPGRDVTVVQDGEKTKIVHGIPHEPKK
jgi:hypothetical protein